MTNNRYDDDIENMYDGNWILILCQKIRFNDLNIRLYLS